MPRGESNGFANAVCNHAKLASDASGDQIGYEGNRYVAVRELVA
jgi:hypothetical protein